MAERNSSSGKQYKIRWRSRGPEFDEWLSADQLGGNELVKRWKIRGKKRAEQEQVARNKRKSQARPMLRADKRFKVGDVVSIFAPRTARTPFYMGRVLQIRKHTVQVQWFEARSIQGVWTEQWEKKLIKGRRQPYVGNISKKTIVERIPRLFGKKKAKLSKTELKRVLELVTQDRNQ
jgi:hypothetical protein